MSDFPPFDVSVLNDLGSISSGFSPSDLNANGITTDILPFLNAKYLTTDTVNAFTGEHFSSLTETQVSALINSPIYGSFSNSAKAQLVTLATTGTLPGTETSNVISSSNKLRKNVLGLLIISIVALNYEY